MTNEHDLTEERIKQVRKLEHDINQHIVELGRKGFSVEINSLAYQEVGFKQPLGLLVLRIFKEID